MSNKTVAIRLSEHGITDAVNEIKSVLAASAKKSRDISRTIAEKIRDRAQTYFNEAWVDELARGVRREADVTVCLEELPDGWRVIARGKDAVFIEFGAGVFFNGSPGASPHPRGAELGFAIGQYGKGQGKRNAWGYYADDGNLVITHGTVAQEPLYRAFREVLDEVRK